MLKIFRRLQGYTADRAANSARKRVARVPRGSRVYAIGDIHGRADLLAQLHGMIAADAADYRGRKVVVYLGDYIDRGSDSKGVIDLLIDAPIEGFEAVYLRGNHEAWLLDFLDNVAVGAAWLFNGGNATIQSYGIERPVGGDARARLTTTQAALVEKLPATHRTFLQNLVLSHEERDYCFVHAGVAPGVPLAEQTADDLLWIREEFLDSDGDFGKVIVHGHTVVPEPEFRWNRIGIDTGAFSTGRLTCLVLDGEDRRLLFT